MITKMTVKAPRWAGMGSWLDKASFKFTNTLKIEYKQIKGLLREEFLITLEGEAEKIIWFQREFRKAMNAYNEGA